MTFRFGVGRWWLGVCRISASITAVYFTELLCKLRKPQTKKQATSQKPQTNYLTSSKEAMLRVTNNNATLSNMRHSNFFNVIAGLMCL